MSDEAYIAALYLNEKDGVIICNMLEEIDQPHPETTLQTDNYTLEGIVNITIFQRRFKSIDMHFYWLRNQGNPKHFQFYWSPGSQNLGDYYKKHHQASHHRPLSDI